MIYRLEPVLGIELFKLMYEIALLAVFFAGEICKILGVINIVGNVRLLLGVKLKALPKRVERLLRNKAECERRAELRAKIFYVIGKLALSEREHIVVCRALAPRSLAHEQNAVFDRVFIAEAVCPHENAEHGKIAGAVLRREIGAQGGNIFNCYLFKFQWRIPLFA